MKYRKSTTIWKYNCCTLFCSTIFVLLFGSTIFVLYFAVQFFYFEFVVQLLYYNLLYNFCTPVLEYSFYTTGRQYNICTIFTVSIFSPSLKYNYSTAFKFAYFHSVFFRVYRFICRIQSIDIVCSFTMKQISPNSSKCMKCTFPGNAAGVCSHRCDDLRYQCNDPIS